MTDGRVDLDELRTRVDRAATRSRRLGIVTAALLMVAVLATASGDRTAGGAVAAVGVVAGGWALRTASRRDNYADRLRGHRAAQVESTTEAGITALEAGNLDRAERHFQQAVDVAESLSTDDRLIEWEALSADDAPSPGVPREYAVATAYLSALAAYRGSASDRSRIESRFEDVESALAAGDEEAAVEHLSALADALSDDAPVVQAVRTSTAATAIDGVGRTISGNLVDAGYDDPLQIALLPPESLTDVPRIGEVTATRIQTSARELASDSAFVAARSADDAVEVYRDRWHDAASQLRDRLLSESANALEGVRALPEPSTVGSDEVDAIIADLETIRSRATDKIDLLDALRRDVEGASWVSLDLSPIAPDGILPTTDDWYDHGPAVALARSETLRDDLGVSESSADRLRSRARERLAGEPPFGQLEAAIDTFVDRVEAYDSIGQWETACSEAITVARRELEQAREAAGDDAAAANEHYQSATEQVDRAESTLSAASFPEEVATEFEESISNVRGDLDGVEQRIREQEQREAVEEARRLVEDAESQVTGSHEAIDASNFEAARSAIDAARDRVDSVSTAGLADEADAVRADLESVRQRLATCEVTAALEDAQDELNRAQGYLAHDVDDVRACLDVARNHVEAADRLLGAAPLSQSTRSDLTERVEKLRGRMERLADRCAEREITEAIDQAAETLDGAREAFRLGSVDRARDRADAAASRLDDLPDDAPVDEVAEVRAELDDVRTRIVQRSVSEYVTTAESTVDQAEAARVAGEEAEAIDAYRRAITTYEAVLADATEASLPETFEIERRIDQLTAEIEETRSQWVQTRTTQIDREIRAGERAVSQGLEAAFDGDLETAEERYETAAEAASAARAWLAEVADGDGDGSLSVSANVVAEYQSAASSLTGHLGYLRTRIEEAAKDEAIDGTATPLAEYYDGIYSVYRAVPETAHPLWRQALTTVLFGGDGLAAGATNYGAQQADRNEASISALREGNGDGESITEFVCIDTTAPRPGDREFVDPDQPIPVAPTSKTVLPIDVDADGVLAAIDLLAEFPATPAADQPGDDTGALLDLEHFRAQVGDRATTGPEGDAEPDDGQSVSDELVDLQRELETQIGES